MWERSLLSGHSWLSSRYGTITQQCSGSTWEVTGGFLFQQAGPTLTVAPLTLPLTAPLSAVVLSLPCARALTLCLWNEL